MVVWKYQAVVCFVHCMVNKQRVKVFFEGLYLSAISKDKGAHREGKYEGSRRQISGPGSTNSIRQNRRHELAEQSEILKLHGHGDVNAAGRWEESNIYRKMLFRGAQLQTREDVQKAGFSVGALRSP